jgi:ribosomal protein L32
MSKLLYDYRHGTEIQASVFALRASLAAPQPQDLAKAMPWLPLALLEPKESQALSREWMSKALVRDGWTFLRRAGVPRAGGKGPAKLWQKGDVILPKTEAIRLEQQAHPERLPRCPKCARVGICTADTCTAPPKQTREERNQKRTAYIASRKAKGICPQCGDPSRPGRMYCQKCSDYSAKFSSRWARTSPKRKVWFRAWQKARHQELRSIVFNHYGSVCACCGERDDRFLTIDHVDNNGSKDHRNHGKSGHRITGGGWYRRIIKLGFPTDLQLLCWNCNHGKEFYGECPHKLPQESREVCGNCGVPR